MRLKPGLQYEGSCPKKECATMGSIVYCLKGMGIFRPNEDIDHCRVRCPLCLSSFTLTGFVLYQCSAVVKFCIKGEKPATICTQLESSRLQLRDATHLITYTALIIDCFDLGVDGNPSSQNIFPRFTPFPASSSKPRLSSNASEFTESITSKFLSAYGSSSLGADPMFARTSPIYTPKPNIMLPRDIFYSQDSIKSKFQCGKDVRTTMELLRDKIITPHDMPTIQVFNWNGNFHSADNRRLWAFKESGVGEIPVDLVSNNRVNWRKLTTTNGGVSIRMRARETLYQQ